jgi:hypothetical protein
MTSQINDKLFSPERFNEIVEATVIELKRLCVQKGGEYAGDADRLANFRRNAQALGLTMEDVWAIYAGKHWDAIQQYVKDARTGHKRLRSEPITGRADDLIVYLLLFKAIVEEREHVANPNLYKPLEGA